MRHTIEKILSDPICKTLLKTYFQIIRDYRLLHKMSNKTGVVALIAEMEVKRQDAHTAILEHMGCLTPDVRGINCHKCDKSSCLKLALITLTEELIPWE